METAMKVNRDCYNSYFYPVEDDSINLMDKLVLHGEEYVKYLDGGSALHLNMDEHMSKNNSKKLIELSGKTGCNYFCTNVKVTICNDCCHINKKTLKKCSECGSDNIEYGTRIIGYLKRISSFSNQRQNEQSRRFYHSEK